MKKQKSIKTGLLIIVIIGLVIGMAGTGFRAVTAIEKNMKNQLGEFGVIVAQEVVSNISNSFENEAVINQLMDEEIKLGLNAAQFVTAGLKQPTQVDDETLVTDVEVVETTEENDQGLSLVEYAEIFALAEVNVYTLDLENIESNMPGNVGTILSSDHAIAQMIKAGDTEI